MSMIRTCCIGLTLLAACAACSPPHAPPEQAPPEPQATELRDAIRAPLDQAHEVEQTLLRAAERREEEAGD